MLCPMVMAGPAMAAPAPDRRSSPYAQGAGCRCGILPLQLFLEALGRRLSGLVVIQAEHHIPEAGVLLQHPMHGLAAGTAQGHIAVLLPSVRVQREEAQQINRGLKHIEQAVLSHVAEAVLGPAALHVDLEGLTQAVGAPLMGVAGTPCSSVPTKTQL